MLTTIRPVILSICFISLLLISVPGETAPAPGIHRLGHAIQMGAFADVRNAERLTTRLQAKGIEAFYFRKDSGIYAVRFGDFPTKEKARAVAVRLVADRLISSYYIAPPNEIVFNKPKPSVWQRPQPVEIRQTREKERPVSVKEPQTGQTTSTENSIDKPLPKQSGNDQGMGAIAARTAERFVGIPYRWGGDTVVDGMDCSGFVKAVYNLCGIGIPRTSQEQFKAGESVLKGDLVDGDLVFLGYPR